MDNTNGTTISATQCGITTTIAYDYSDIDIHELLDAFRRVAIGLTYGESTWKDAVIEMARQYMDEQDALANEDMEDTDDLEDILDDLTISNLHRYEYDRY